MCCYGEGENSRLEKIILYVYIHNVHRTEKTLIMCVSHKYAFV